MARTWRGPPLQIPDVPIHQYVLSKVARHGDTVCVIDRGNGRSYTYNDVVSLSKRTANGFKSKLGMRKGDVIVFLKTNSADFLCAMYGAMMVGGIVAPINPNSTAYELKHYLNVLRPRFVFTESRLVPVVRQGAQQVAAQLHLTLITCGAETAAADDVTLSSLQSHPGEWREAEWDGTTDTATWPALVLFSSGTTGLPKGVVLSHRNLMAVTLKWVSGQPPGQVQLVSFPLYHIAGLSSGGFARLVSGYTQVFFPRFEFEEFLQAIDTYKPVSLTIPPPLIVLIVKSPLLSRYDVSSVRDVITGGGITKKSTENEFKTLFNNPVMRQAYGLTETGGGIMMKYADEGHIKPGSVGKVVAGGEAKIVDPDTGAMLAADQRGEVYLRAPHAMLGYWANPKATAETIDKDGWVHTGDIGYYDSDGYFYIVDRLKELIKYNAFQVAPAELEAMILEHPGVADVGVIGVPDKMAGELPRAYVVRQEDSKITEKDIQDFVKDRATYYKWLRGGVVFIDAIPKLPSGKILRRHLRELSHSSSKL